MAHLILRYLLMHRIIFRIIVIFGLAIQLSVTEVKATFKAEERPTFVTTKFGKAGKEVLLCLEDSLRLYEADPNRTVFPKPKGRDPLSAWVEFAYALSELTDYNVKNRIWGRLADCFAKIVMNSKMTEDQHRLCNDYFYKKGSSINTYRQFVSFVQRLTFLTSYDVPIIPSDSTRVEDYCLAIHNCMYNGIQCWLTEEGFQDALSRVGTNLTKEMMSPFAILQHSAPDIFTLAYPYETSVGDILQTTPAPDGSHLWLVGWTTSNVYADGILYSPCAFYQHDLLHYMLYYLSLSGGLTFHNVDMDGKKLVDMNGKKLGKQISNSWNSCLEAREIFFEIVRGIQGLQSLVRGGTLELVNYFGFYLVHDGPLIERLILMGHEIFAKTPIYSAEQWMAFCDENYYGASLPAVLQELRKGVRLDIFVSAGGVIETPLGNDSFEKFKFEYLNQRGIFIKRLKSHLENSVLLRLKEYIDKIEKKQQQQTGSIRCENLTRLSYELIEYEVLHGPWVNFTFKEPPFSTSLVTPDRLRIVHRNF